MRGVEQLQVKRLQNILAPNGACLLLLKKDQWILNYLAWYSEWHSAKCRFAECDCSLFSGFVAFPFFSKNWAKLYSISGHIGCEQQCLGHNYYNARYFRIHWSFFNNNQQAAFGAKIFWSCFTWSCSTPLISRSGFLIGSDSFVQYINFCFRF